MPFTPYKSAFDPKTMQILQVAFDMAWSEVSESPGVQDDQQAARNMIARRLVDAWRGRCTIKERLARWLLMSQGRLDGQNIRVTHGSLSIMLGARRPGITIALQTLETVNFIRYTRGCITIVGRPKLEQIAGRAYSAPGSQ